MHGRQGRRMCRWIPFIQLNALPKARLKELLERKPRQAEHVLTLLPDAIGRFKVLIDDLANPTNLHVDKARAALRGLLGKDILLHPTADGTKQYLTAEIAGDYAGLLRLETGKNKFGGGQPIQPTLGPLLRFTIQGVAFAA